MARNNEVQVKFSVFNKEYNESMKEMRAETGKLTKEFMLEQEQLKSNGTESEKLQSKLQYLQRRHELTEQSVQAATEQLARARELYGDNSREAENLENRLLSAQIAEQRLENQVNATSEALQNEQNTLRQVGDELNNTADRIGTFADKTKEIGQGFTQNVTLPILGAGAAGIAASENLDNALSKINNKLGLAGDNSDFYEESLKNIGSTGVGSFEEISEAIVKVEQNMEGISNESFDTVIEQAMQIADVMDYDVSEVTRSASTLMQQFGIDGETSLDLIVRGFQNGLDFSGEFLDSINEYSVQFQSLGFDADDMFNTLIAGAEAGAFNLDKVGDAVKEFNIRAKDGSDTTAEAFESLGFNSKELTKKFAEGGEEAQKSFNEVVNALESVDDQQKKNELGIALFGTQYEDLESDVIGALATMKDGLGDYSNAAEDIAEENENLAQILKGAWNDLQVALKPAGDSLKDLLKNVIPPLIEKVKILGDKFANLSPTGQEIILMFLGLLAVIGPLLVIIGTLAGAVSSIIGLFGGFATAAGTAGATAGTTGVATTGLGATIAGLIGPILLVVGVITGLILILKKLYKDNEQFRVLVDSAWASIQETITNAIKIVSTFIKDIFGGLLKWWKENQDSIKQASQTIWKFIQSIIMNVINSLVPFIKISFDIIKNTIAIVWSAISSIIKIAIELIKGIIMIAVHIINGDWSSAWETIKSTFINIWNIIRFFLSNTINAIKNIILSVLRNLLGGVGSKINSIKNTIIKGISTAVDYIKSLPRNMLQYGKNIIEGLVNGIKSKIKAVKNVVSDVADTVKSKIKGALGIHSPSKVMTEMGGYTGEGFVIGIKDKIKSVKKAAQKISESVTSIVSDMPAIGEEYAAATVNGESIPNYATNSTNNQFIIHATVRSDEDIDKIVDEVDKRLGDKL